MKANLKLITMAIVSVCHYVNPNHALAQIGSLDNSFNFTGMVTTDFGRPQDNGVALALQSDGKIVLVGDDFNGNNTSPMAEFSIARYNTDGSLDVSFDLDGKVTEGFSTNYGYAKDVVIQPDGKIVVAGYASNGNDYDFAIVRYNTDGTLDVNFDTDGKVTTDFGSQDYAYCMALQSDGKLQVGGVVFDGVSYPAKVVRYKTNGSIDSTFGVNGIATYYNASISEMVIQSDGKIVGGGTAGVDFGLVRFNTDGSLDLSFGTSGGVVTDFAGASEVCTGITIQNDGKIIAVGYMPSLINGSVTDFAMARYNTDGTLDVSFDGDGKLSTDFFGLSDYATGAVVQNDGKIILAGMAFNGGNYDFAVARYNSDGSVDNTFDADGKRTTDFGNTSDAAADVAIQSDGKIVLAGGSNGDFGLARYIGICTPVYTSQTPVLCFGNTLAVGDSTYTMSGNYQNTFTAFNGCDSIVSTNLTVLNDNNYTLSPTLCAGQSIVIGTNTYSSSGNYVDILTSLVTGCDSTVTTNLTVLPANTLTQSPIICAGETLTVGTSNYTISGTYTDVFASLVNGCDSTVTTNITVLSANTFSQSPVVCFNQSVVVGSNIYSASGTYTDVLTSLVNGCDSTITTNLTVLPNNTYSQSPSICAGETFTVGTSTYLASGTYTNVLTSLVSGCDSTVITILTVHSLPNVTFTINPDTVCLNHGTFTLVGGLPAGGTYSGAGVSGGNFSPSVATAGIHPLIYTYTDANTCTNSDTSSIFVSLCTGIEEVSTDDLQSVVAPNPNSGLFTIAVLASNNLLWTVEVYNMIGDKVMETSITNELNHVIDLSSSPKGIYFVRVSQERMNTTTVHSHRIVIQ